MAWQETWQHWLNEIRPRNSATLTQNILRKSRRSEVNHRDGMTQRQEDYPIVRQDTNMFHVQGWQQAAIILLVQLDLFFEFSPNHMDEYIFKESKKRTKRRLPPFHKLVYPFRLRWNVFRINIISRCMFCDSIKSKLSLFHKFSLLGPKRIKPYEGELF